MWGGGGRGGEIVYLLHDSVFIVLNGVGVVYLLYDSVLLS